MGQRADAPPRASAKVRRQRLVPKTGALQKAILNSENFSSIATDERGVIQVFNVGAARMRGYDAPISPTASRWPNCSTRWNP